MRILLTGATGFVGRTLTKHLSTRNHAIICVSRHNQAEREGCTTCWTREHALSEPSPSPVDALIHLEVKQHVFNPSRADLIEFNRVNVEGTGEWLRWCATNKVERFVYFSTIKAVEPIGHEPLTEDADQTPANTPYGRSKWQAEGLVQNWAKEKAGRCALILRPAVAYGPGNEANMYAMLDGIAQGRFFLIGKNDNVKSLISLQNLVAATSFLMERMKPGCEKFNIIDEQSYSVRTLAELMANALGRRVKTIPLSSGKMIALTGDAIAKITGKNFPLTSSRLRTLTETTHFSCAKLLSTGFRHPQSTADGLTQMVDWYLGRHETRKPADAWACDAAGQGNVLRS